MENQILEILKSMQEQMNRLETKVEGLEKGQQRLELKVEGLEQGQQRLELKVNGLEQGQKEIKYQLSEFQIEYSNTVKDLSYKVDAVTTDVKAIK